MEPISSPHLEHREPKPHRTTSNDTAPGVTTVSSYEQSRIILLRTFFFLLGAILTIVSGIVIVRKLTVDEYAIYQIVNKRLALMAMGVIQIIDLWIFRDVARLFKGSLLASLKIGLLVGTTLSVVSGIYIYDISRDIIVSLMSATAILTYTMWLISLNILDATRPVMVSIQRLLTRLTYVSLVILLVYLLAKGLIGSLTALITGYAVGVVLTYLWTKKRIEFKLEEVTSVSIRELLNLERIKAGIYRGLMMIFGSLDAVIVIKFLGSLVVSAFFVLRLIMSILSESVNISLRYLQYAGLKGNRAKNLLFLLRMELAIVAGPLVFIAYYNDHTIYVLNPSYIWISPLIVLVSVESVVRLLTNGVMNILLGEIKSRDVEEAYYIQRYFRIRFWLTIMYIIYVVVLAYAYTKGLLLDTDYSFIELWILGSLVTWIGHLVSYMTVEEFRKRLPLRLLSSNVLGYLLLYVVAAIVIVQFIGPGSAPSPYFWEEVSILLKPAIIYYTIYLAIIVVLDQEIRKTISLVIKEKMR